MACCFGKTTDAIEPKKSLADESDASPAKPIIPVNNPPKSKIEYSITVKTGDLRNSGTNGPVYINIFGRDEKETKDLLLAANDKPFSQGSLRKFQINAVDVGKPQRVVIRHEDQSTGWYVDYVEISVHNFLIRFVANRWLNRLKNDRKLEVELFGSEQPAVTYEIEVETGDEQEETLDAPVFVQIFGSTTTTPKLFLEPKTSPFNANSTNKFTLSSNNVGEIQRIVVGHEGLGQNNDWLLKRVHLQMLSQQQEYVVNQWLSPTKGNQQLSVDLSPVKPRSPTPTPVEPKYLILIQTANVIQTETTENVEMIVRGSQGQIGKFLLKQNQNKVNPLLFQSGNLDEFELNHKNIGEIESITVGFSESEQRINWLLEYVKINYQGKTYHFNGHCWLSNRLGPNFSWITMKPDGHDDDVLYKINVKTGRSGIDANVILCIFGDANSTPNLPLRQVKSGADAKFDENTSLEFDVKTTDVGKIKKINIGHDGKGADHQWFLESITIDKGDEHYQFDAHRWLAEEKDDKKTYVDLFLIERSSPTPTTTPGREQTSYHITVVTKSDENSGTDSGVLMTIFGDQDATKQFQLTRTKQGDAAKFSEGTTNEFEMNLVDVGQITKINIGQDGKGSHPKWSLETVQIKKGTQNYNFYANQTLDQTNAFVSLTPSSGALVAKKTSSPDQTKMSTSRSGTPRNATPQTGASRNATPQPKVTKKEVSYKISIQTSSEQEEPIDTDSSIYLILHGQEETSPKLLLKDGLITDKKHALKNDSKTEFEFKCLDLGKVKKLVLGQEEGSEWHVEFVTVKHNFETTTFNAEKIIEPHSSIELVPSAIPKKNESTYKVLLRTATQQGETGENHLTLKIIGTNGQTKKLPLNETTKTNKKAKIKKEETIEFDVKGNDVGRITKIILENDGDDQSLVWHIHHITIKRGILTTTFNVSRKLDPRTPLEFQPSPLPTKSETPRPQVKTPDTAPPLVTETKDSDYEITITTGVQTLQAPANLKIRGEKGIVTIPLTKTTSGNEPFQTNATDTFVCRTTDVGRIRRITLENTETNPEKIWHVQTVEIKKDNEILQFVGDVRLDWKSRHANLYPVGALHGQLKEDYVQTELRRLRENLRTESSKLRAPAHKAHEPFLYNDLSPYFDTSAVERAIYLPLEAPLTYHTRITALRIVEPWEAHAMDYGVSYELMKSRKGRSFSAKRPNAASNDASIDRKQGSTHLPKFPCVDMKKPREYARTFTVNDVPKIRSLIRSRYTAQAQGQIEKDYKRTREDIYRMQLDDMKSYHQSNRDNMVQIYHSYLENTPGSKKALQELCDQLPSTEIKNDTA